MEGDFYIDNPKKSEQTAKEPQVTDGNKRKKKLKKYFNSFIDIVANYCECSRLFTLKKLIQIQKQIEQEKERLQKQKRQKINDDKQIENETDDNSQSNNLNYMQTYTFKKQLQINIKTSQTFDESLSERNLYRTNSYERNRELQLYLKKQQMNEGCQEFKRWFFCQDGKIEDRDPPRFRRNNLKRIINNLEKKGEREQISDGISSTLQQMSIEDNDVLDNKNQSKPLQNFTIFEHEYEDYQEVANIKKPLQAYKKQRRNLKLMINQDIKEEDKEYQYDEIMFDKQLENFDQRSKSHEQNLNDDQKPTKTQQNFRSTFVDKKKSKKIRPAIKFQNDNDKIEPFYTDQTDLFGMPEEQNHTKSLKSGQKNKLDILDSKIIPSPVQPKENKEIDGVEVIVLDDGPNKNNSDDHQNFNNQQFKQKKTETQQQKNNNHRFGKRRKIIKAQKISNTENYTQIVDATESFTLDLKNQRNFRADDSQMKSNTLTFNKKRRKNLKVINQDTNGNKTKEQEGDVQEIFFADL